MKTCTCTTAEETGIVHASRSDQPNENSLVTIESEPLIGETPSHTLQSWLTPNSRFYVRNHFSTPTFDSSHWSLSVEGCVDQPLELDYSGITQLHKHTLAVTMECAGNNRSDLEPQVPGNPFRDGAVSTAMWGGTHLKDVLDKAGIQQNAVEVLFEGMDNGEPEPGRESVPYLRSLPVDVAMHPDTMLAYEMNGEELSLDHGAPVRLVVPGWYGMASVKWLRRVTALAFHFEGFFQTERYIIEDDRGLVTPVAQIGVKSIVTWPQHGGSLPFKACSVKGLAWSGHSCIRTVEVSDDYGESWREAELAGIHSRYAWQQWNFEWQPRAKGHNTLVARATDDRGNRQPLDNSRNRLGYVINGVKPVCVTVGA